MIINTQEVESLIKSKSSLSDNWNTTTMRELKTLASASQDQIQGDVF